jgi:hypothetical protein
MAEVAHREQQLIKLVRAIAGLAGGLLFGVALYRSWESATVVAAVVIIAWYKIESWIQNS